MQFYLGKVHYTNGASITGLGTNEALGIETA